MPAAAAGPGGLAAALADADADFAPRVTAAIVRDVVGLVPPDWLDVEPSVYVDRLLARVGGERPWVTAMFEPLREGGRG